MARSKPKNRKRKYLSLRRHIAPPPPPTPTPVEKPPIKEHQKADLFPPQQEPDRDPQVASLLFSSSKGETGETLTEILGAASASTGEASDLCSAASPESPPVGLRNGDDGDGLARRALRGRQRVEYCCSSPSEGEVASGVATGGGIGLWCPVPRTSLLLKLDYEEILAAWSDRGPLYIDGDRAHVVPGSHHTAFPVWMAVGTSGEATTMAWMVPDKVEKPEVETREMRVKRYKEKRHNRLFAKKIRYEVRKLNAEKRPRLKGRFIKAIEDV